mgnify:CR=1 FL=1
MGTSRLTILFDDPFWIGLYEREDDTEYSVCRIVFGAEPRDQEVYAYLLEHWRTLRFSPPRPGTEHLPPPKSPKRRQREARRMTQAAGIGTKAQQALSEQREAIKQSARRLRKQRHSDKKQERFELRVKKRKQKHRGH